MRTRGPAAGRPSITIGRAAPGMALRPRSSASFAGHRQPDDPRVAQLTAEIEALKKPALAESELRWRTSSDPEPPIGTLIADQLSQLWLREGNAWYRLIGRDRLTWQDLAG